VTVDEVAALPFSLDKGSLRLQKTVIEASGKEIAIEHVEALSCTAASTGAPLASTPGISSNGTLLKSKIKSLGWEAETSLREGIGRIYAWIEEQVKQTRNKGARER
jgi:nucleoside-diphosphate-sugar epimerase